MFGILGVTCMMFLSVSGGPFGLENAMIYTDFMTTICILTWLLFTYMIPLSIMNYELILKMSLPYNIIGPVEWIYVGLGKTAGIMNSIWDIIDTIIDNAIYPVLFADNIIALGCPPEHRYVYGWAMILFVTVFNYFELESAFSILQTFIIIIPFIIAWIIFKPSNMYSEKVLPDIDSIRTSITIIMWNVNGYDMAAPYANRVKTPEKTYFIAFFVNTILIYLWNIITYSIGISIYHSKTDWYDGIFVQMGNDLSGMWLMVLMGISAAVSSSGTLTAEICSTAYLFKGLHECGVGPSILKNRKFNILLNGVILFFSVFLDLEMLIKWSTVLNSFTLFMECYTWGKFLGWNVKRTVCTLLICINNILVMSCVDLNCIVFMVVCFGFGLSLAYCHRV